MKRKNLFGRYYIPIGFLFFFLICCMLISIFFDLNDYKDIIEDKASNALNMQVIIDGNLDYTLFPPSIEINSSQIKKDTLVIFSSRQTTLYPHIGSLFLLQIKFKEVILHTPKFNFVKTSSGLFNFDDSSKTVKSAPPLPYYTPVNTVTIKNGELRYLNTFTNDTINFAQISGRLYNINIGSEEGKGLLGNLSFFGEISSSQSNFNWFSLKDTEFSVKAIDGLFNSKVNLVNTDDEFFEFELDFKKKDYVYKINYTQKNTPYENFCWVKNPIKGNINYSIKVKTADIVGKNLVNTLSGMIHIDGKNLEIPASTFEKINSASVKNEIFDFIKVVSPLFEIPFGAGVCELSNNYPIKDSSNSYVNIDEYKSDWIIQNGTAKANNVYLRSKILSAKLDGKINFNKNKFSNLEISILDSTNCILLKQYLNKIYRPTNEKITKNPFEEKVIFTDLADSCNLYYNREFQ